MMERTDWDCYYRTPYKFSVFSRNITTRSLISFMKKYLPPQPALSFAELGGANSCFFEAVTRQFSPKEYAIIDSNEYGLEVSRKKWKGRQQLSLHLEDVHAIEPDERFDLVFSVGLVEHFDPEGTRRAIRAHFSILKAGGIAIISAPTPTFLYRCSRKISTLLGMWLFVDERPLKIAEIEAAVSPFGSLLARKVIWPIFFTQAMLVIRKR